jgi:hypothetical protein
MPGGVSNCPSPVPFVPHFSENAYVQSVDTVLGRSDSVFRGDPPRGRTENLLIKSKLFFVHRRAHQSTVGTILRLKAKIVPTGKNKMGLNSRNMHAT